MTTGRPVDKILNGVLKSLCVLIALLQDQTILMRLPSPKLTFELFLIYSKQIKKNWLTLIFYFRLF